MRRFVCWLIVLIVLNWPILAADEFGERFSNTALSALEDIENQSELDLIAEGLKEIEPATGEEKTEGLTQDSSAPTSPAQDQTIDQ